MVTRFNITRIFHKAIGVAFSVLHQAALDDKAARGDVRSSGG
jgi:hypothetical protein